MAVLLPFSSEARTHGGVGMTVFDAKPTREAAQKKPDLFTQRGSVSLCVGRVSVRTAAGAPCCHSIVRRHTPGNDAVHLRALWA